MWDGHTVGQGRIVCHATWHHFVNINLDGSGAVPAPRNNRRGLRDATLNVTADFHQIAEYYRNIADWITLQPRRWGRRWIDLLIERFRFPLIEEWRPLPPHPCPWEPRVALGRLVEDALTTHRGQSFTTELVKGALDAAEFEDFAALVRPLRVEEPGRTESSRLLVSADELRWGVLGSFLDTFMRDLPGNPLELPKALAQDEHEDELLQHQAVEAARSAIDAARDFYVKRAQHTLEFLGHDHG